MMLMLVWRCAHDNSICAYVMDVLVLHVVAHGVPTICQHMESPTMLSEHCITTLVALHDVARIHMTYHALHLVNA